jgi:hypothetical protein
VRISTPEETPAENPRRPQSEAPRRGKLNFQTKQVVGGGVSDKLPASAMTPDERQRKKDREGLQYGAPKFVVSPDGTLKE